MNEIPRPLHGPPLLDNPIWHALSTSHARYAEGDDLAKCYPASITPLAAMAVPSPCAYASLGRILQPGGAADLFVGRLPEPPSDWEVLRATPVAQMVWTRSSPTLPDVAPVEMTLTDAAEMVALAQVARPGPLTARALELGRFLGIRNAGHLVALAGERLRMTGYVEISGVCTHPDHRGRGYAQVLVTAVASRIASGGNTPVLHVDTSNASAVHVHEKLGFRTRQLMEVVVLKAPA